MELTTQVVANVMVIQVAGRIDHTTAKDFEDTLLPQLAGCTGLVQQALLDLSQVPYMSSAGLRVLTLARKQCQAQHRNIVVAALQPMLQEVFKISRFDTLFTVYPTVQEALAALAPSAPSA